MSNSKKETANVIAKGTSRRGFFKLAGAAGFVAGTLANSETVFAGPIPAPKANLKKFTAGKFPKAPVMATGRVLGANDRINVAFIGIGGMGGRHLDLMRKNAKALNIQPMAVSDVFSKRLEGAKAKILASDPEIAVQAEKDYRKILENKDVDAVVIATPEHWHCQIGVHALEAGKHCYVEKPVARYLDEGFQLYDASKKFSKLVVQVGSHGTSDPKYHAAREVVASGKLGQLVTAQSSYTRNAGTKGEWNYAIDPDANAETVDWDMWLGSAAKRPWNDDAKERFFRYRKFRDYSSGILGDLMPHRVHPIFLALNVQDWPTKVHCVGTKKISLDREVSDTVSVMAEMESGWTFVFLGSTVNEQGVQELIRGHKATLYLAGTSPEIKAERPYAEEVEGGPVAVENSGESHEKHEKNFFDSIREGKQPNCNMDLAIRAQAFVALAEISEMSGRTVEFDSKKRTWKYA